jgi:hypothetical protein
LQGHGEQVLGRVDHKDLGAVLRTFAPGAVFTIQSAFTTYEGRDTGIKKMFENLSENYEVIVHKEFVHVVDTRTMPARRNSTSN